MNDPRFQKWDDQLKAIFSAIDETLEDEYGGLYPLHPARPPRGGTANPSSNGLFNVGASFTAGYGSEKGRGYAVDIHMSTLSNVPGVVRREIEKRAQELLRQKLDQAFPKKELHVERDGNVIKVFGDLSPG